MRTSQKLKPKSLLTGLALATALGAGAAVYLGSSSTDQTSKPNQAQREEGSYTPIHAPETEAQSSQTQTGEEESAEEQSASEPENAAETADKPQTLEERMAESLKGRDLKLIGVKPYTPKIEKLREYMESLPKELQEATEVMLKEREGRWYGVVETSDGPYIGLFDLEAGIWRHWNKFNERGKRFLEKSEDVSTPDLDELGLTPQDLEDIKNDPDGVFERCLSSARQDRLYSYLVQGTVIENTAKEALEQAENRSNKTQLLMGLLAGDSREKAFMIRRLALLVENDKPFRAINENGQLLAEIPTVEYITGKVLLDKARALSLTLEDRSMPWAAYQANKMREVYFDLMLGKHSHDYEMGGHVALYFNVKDYLASSPLPLDLMNLENVAAELFELGGMISSAHRTRRMSDLNIAQFSLLRAGGATDMNNMGVAVFGAAGLAAEGAYVTLWGDRDDTGSFFVVLYADPNDERTQKPEELRTKVFTGTFGEVPLKDDGSVNTHSRDWRERTSNAYFNGQPAKGWPGVVKIYTRSRMDITDQCTNVTPFVERSLGREIATEQVTPCVFNYGAWRAVTRNAFTADTRGNVVFDDMGHCPSQNYGPGEIPNDGILIGVARGNVPMRRDVPLESMLDFFILQGNGSVRTVQETEIMYKDGRPYVNGVKY